MQSRSGWQAMSSQEVDMPKGSETLTAARKEEIISACRKLYAVRSFKEITIKEIGDFLYQNFHL